MEIVANGVQGISIEKNKYLAYIDKSLDEGKLSADKLEWIARQDRLLKQSNRACEGLSRITWDCRHRMCDPDLVVVLEAMMAYLQSELKRINETKEIPNS